MSQAELLELVLGVLNRLGIESMLVGSYASSFYGEARSTHDIDLVIDLPAEKIDSLVASFDPNRYYLSAQALREGRMANLIDTLAGDKVDLFLLSDQQDARREFTRRKSVNVLGLAVSIASPEDTIVAKLRWSQEMDGSERHQSDVREIIRRQKSKLDFDAGRIRADQKCRGTRVIVKEKRETEIAMETEAGRQGLAVWWRAQDQMTGEQRLLKALELTETSRQVMRDGIRQQNPHASEAEIQELYVDRLLSFHGLSLDEIRRRQVGCATTRPK